MAGAAVRYPHCEVGSASILTKKGCGIFASSHESHCRIGSRLKLTAFSPPSFLSSSLSALSRAAVASIAARPLDLAPSASTYTAAETTRPP